MRVASFSVYDSFKYNQQASMKELNRINTQMNGLKIQYGYEDVNIAVNTLRLDQEENSLKQTSQASKSGLEFAQNSDKALNDMTTALTSFKTKLINAASDTNGTTNRDAIAKELSDLKSYMMTIANSSINGKYLFSGSSMSTRPIANDGTYMGNDQNVKALIDSNVQYAFNVDGQSLFLGQDSDYKKSISTNVPKKNLTLLNSIPPEDRYINEEDKVRDMTGNNGDGLYSYFYVSGKTSEGTSFKHIIQESIDSPISDLLSKIKNEFSGNVDVSLNQNGEIEIKDLRSGSSQIDFNIVGYDHTVPLTKATAGVSAGSYTLTMQDATGISVGDVLNIDQIGQFTVDSVSGNDVTFTSPLQASKNQLAGDVNVRKVLSDPLPSVLPSGTNGLSDGVRITEFSKSGSGPREIGNVTGNNDYWDHREFGFNIELKRKQDNKIATSSDLLSDIIGSSPDATNFGIVLNGVVPPATVPDSTTTTFALSSTSTVGDYVAQIQQALNSKFGQNKFQANINDYGKITIQDLTISEEEKSLQSSNLVGVQLTAPSNTFAGINGIETSRVYFDKSGSKLTSNAPQVVKSTSTDHNNNYATPDTKLVDVAGVSSLEGRSLTMDIINRSGTQKNISVSFGSTNSTFAYDMDSVAIAGFAGDTSVEVANGAGFSAGDTIKIGGENYTVDGVSGTTVWLTTGLNADISEGDSIKKQFEIIDASNPQGYTPANDVSYQQLMDVISMVTSGSIPATTTAYPGPLTTDDSTNYNTATMAAQKAVSVKFDQMGRITLEDMSSSSTNTKLMFSMYDSELNTGFSTTKSINSSSDNTITLNSNGMLTLDDPHVSFFDMLDGAIESVKSGKIRADYTNSFDSRNTGMENAITRIEHILQHTIKKHTEVGAISNAFTSASDRAESLKLNVISVRSSFIDTDIAEAAANLNQKMLSYQAMLSTISKINGLSLVNYLK